jgi:hypothetical protein
MLAWPVAASATPRSGEAGFDAPGLTAGPFITDTGLVWEGKQGVVLTSFAGRSRVLLPPDAPNFNDELDVAWFGRRWWAAARPQGVLAGRIGGGLRELPLLRHCNPGSPRFEPAVHYAISGEQLYAALPRVCFARRRAPFGVVVDVDLRSRHWHVVAPIPGTLDFLAVSGKYLALAYWRSAQRPTGEARPLVRVLNSATGALEDQLTPPRSTGAGAPSGTSGIQVDERGDVLVSEGCCAAPPGRLAHAAMPPAPRKGWWWARAGSKVGHEVKLGEGAALSDGRVAFFSTEPRGSENPTIEVRNLLAGTARTAVVFTGSASAESLALSGEELAWAQQSTVVQVLSRPTPGGGSFESCTRVALGPIELASLDMRSNPTSPVVVGGVPIPPQYANEPGCVES